MTNLQVTFRTLQPPSSKVRQPPLAAVLLFSRTRETNFSAIKKGRAVVGVKPTLSLQTYRPAVFIR
jgi:hypothetical protein